ncbi:MAG: hypothetical protein P1Q69_07075 [Candidatus Thorarchaeota archaeon]|nr:hypothetical protein [Candidatus Thorarchaeota archaeon]
MRSSVTGQPVDKGTFIIPNHRWTIIGVLEELLENIESCVSEYFGTGATSKERIENYKQLIEEIRSVLSSLKKKV